MKCQLRAQFTFRRLESVVRLMTRAITRRVTENGNDRKACTPFQRYHRAQLWWVLSKRNRTVIKNHHPSRPVAGLREGFNDFKRLEIDLFSASKFACRSLNIRTRYVVSFAFKIECSPGMSRESLQRRYWRERVHGQSILTSNVLFLGHHLTIRLNPSTRPVRDHDVVF